MHPNAMHRSIALAILLFPMERQSLEGLRPTHQQECAACGSDNSNCIHTFQNDMNLNPYTGEPFAKIRQYVLSSSWRDAIDCFVKVLESSIDDTTNRKTGHDDYFRFRMGAIIAELFHSTPESQRPCPFLRAMAGPSDGAKSLCENTIHTLIGNFQEVFGAASLELGVKSLLSCDYIPDAFKQCLWLRCATLQLVWHAGSKACTDLELEQNIYKLITEYQFFLSTNVWQEKNVPYKSDYPTSAMYALKTSQYERATKLGKALDQVVLQNKKASPRDPAVAFLAETFLVATQQQPTNSKPIGGSWIAGDTWVLLGAASQADAGGTGMVLKLRVGRAKLHDDVSQCAGACYPDPEYSAYHFVDRGYQTAIRNGWLVAIGDQSLEHDFKWRVVAHDDSDKKPFNPWKETPTDLFDDNQEPFPSEESWKQHVPHRIRQLLPLEGLFGKSATLAYGLAIKSCQLQQRLRSDWAPSATFVMSLAPMSTNPSLGEVTLISEKDDNAYTTLCTDIRWQSDDVILADKIRRIAVATNQPSTLVPKIKLKQFPNFKEAYRNFIEYEVLLEDHSDLVAKHWSQMAAVPNIDDQDDLYAKRERLDLYIWPQLEWEVLNLEKQEGEDKWIRTSVGGQDHGQLTSVFTKLRNPDKPRHLVVHDGAGSGKTVLSMQIEHHATEKTKREAMFGDSRPRLVVRYEKQLPASLTKLLENGEKPSIEQILAADPTLLKLVGEPTDEDAAKQAKRIKLVEYALEQGRVVLIIDGYDEFGDEDKGHLKNLFSTTDTSLNFGSDPKRVLWIVLGREHAIDDERTSQGSTWLQDSTFKRLRIKLFRVEKQDEYIELAFPDLKSTDWRSKMMPTLTKDEQDELLSLPHTLNQIVQLIQLHRTNKKGSLPEFESQSDLFLQTEIPLLKRALTKRSSAEEAEDKKIDRDMAGQLRILETALCCLAFQMALGKAFRSMTGGAVVDTKNAALTRFENIIKTDDRSNSNRVLIFWKWAYNRLGTIATSNGGPNTAVGEQIIAFRTNRIFENYVARFLTKYAIEDTDLKEALPFIGDKQWETIWHWAIQMPLKDREIIADHARYAAAIRLLFQRPSKSEHRRPTELMYLAEQWLDSRDFKITKDSPTLKAQFTLDLQTQFKELSESGTEDQKRIAAELWDIDKNYVEITAGKLEGSDGELNGREIASFRLCKFQLTNEQFQLFDNNFAGWTEGKRLDSEKKIIPCSFKGCRNPSIFASFFDAHWYCRFLSDDAAKQFRLPKDAEWEYACRGGSKKNYCFGDKESDLVDYAWFSDNSESTTHPVGKLKSNGSGLYDMHGNVWEWVDEKFNRGSDRVIRGGGWNGEAAFCRSADRSRSTPASRPYYLGFRVALSSTGIPSKEK